MTSTSRQRLGELRPRRLVGVDLVQREHRAILRIAGIGAPHPRRVGEPRQERAGEAGLHQAPEVPGRHRRERLDAAPRAAGGADATSRRSLREAWLISLADAGEVIPAPAITPVPLTKLWFRGAVNIRGKLYGVVDFSAWRGGASA